MEAPVSTMHPSSNPEDQPTRPSRASLRGLDWFTFFVADIQTSFGPFIAVYLTTQKWTLGDIGLVLTIGGLVGLIGQMPGGAVVDAVRSERRAAAWAVVGIGVSALVLALWPIFIIVVAARVLHAGSSCVLGPALAAISLGLVGHSAIGERLGRNARFASVGNGLSAAVMGAVGYFLSSAAVFFVAAALAIPALASLFRIRADEIDPATAHGGIPEPQRATLSGGLHLLFHNRPLLVLAGCAAILLAFVSDPYLLVVVHVLDGVSAAVLGVLVPLITADVTRGTGRFNLAQGMIGTAVGIGASVSGVLTGSVADLSGSTVAFLMLAAAGGVGLTSVWVLMPETRDLAMKPTTCRPVGR
jgi:predicted MFS family arabinose efflux permease